MDERTTDPNAPITTTSTALPEPDTAAALPVAEPIAPLPPADPRPVDYTRGAGNMRSGGTTSAREKLEHGYATARERVEQGYATASETVRERWEEGKRQAQMASDRARAQALRIRQEIERRAEEDPLQVIAVSAAIGFATGLIVRLLLSRRDDDETIIVVREDQVVDDRGGWTELP